MAKDLFSERRVMKTQEQNFVPVVPFVPVSEEKLQVEQNAELNPAADLSDLQSSFPEISVKESENQSEFASESQFISTDISVQPKYKLRPYQQECVNVVNALPDGSKSVVVLATGLGKSLTAARFETKGRMLWLSHRDELVRQPEKFFQDIGKSYGIEKAGEFSNGEDVVSASVQTLRSDKRLHRFKPDEFDIIVCDEAHHAAAVTYRKVLHYFKPRKLIGLTATPKRGDGVRLTDVFDNICFSRDLRWGIENGYLSRIRCMRVESDFDLSKVSMSMGDYSASGLGDAMAGSDNAYVVAKVYKDYALSENRQTIIYCPIVLICNDVKEAIITLIGRDKADTVQVVSDKTPPKERQKILDDFRDNKVNCLLNCMILTEGTDLPNVSCIINNRPSSNNSLYEQMIGRGTRLAEGKEYCLVIDVLPLNAGFNKICTAPSLMGLDLTYLPDNVRDDFEGGDLLELIMALVAALGGLNNGSADDDIKIDPKIKVQLVDIFEQKLISIIDKNKGKGYSAVADAYRDEIESAVSGYDFGDMLVTENPDDRHHYEIKPTFQGHVWFSKPDMLDKTDVEFEISDAYFNGRSLDFIITGIDMNDAISRVYDILKYIVPQYFATSWSKSARKLLSEEPATGKQKGLLGYTYGSRLGRPDNDMTKLQASDLINLDNEITRLEEKKRHLMTLSESKDYAKIATDEKASKKDRKKAGEIIGNLYESAKSVEEKRQNKILAYRSLSFQFDAEIKRKKSLMNSMKGNIGEPQSFSIIVRNGSSDQISEKQVDYIKKLVEKIEKNRKKRFNECNGIENLDKSQASAVIDSLNFIETMSVPDRYVCFYNLQKLVTDLKSGYKTLEFGFQMMQIKR